MNAKDQIAALQGAIKAAEIFREEEYDTGNIHDKICADFALDIVKHAANYITNKLTEKEEQDGNSRQ